MSLYANRWSFGYLGRRFFFQFWLPPDCWMLEWEREESGWRLCVGPFDVGFGR